MNRKNVKDLEDANSAAYNVLRHVIEATEGQAAPKPTERVKNPAAVALGLLGASKGGKARAKALTKAQRKEIAQRAANERWGNLQ